ncbi:MAG: polysaccharide biosynthesis tyrosine autokinase, partial [Anaerolineales bacterium]|nr:polysaccharide biosynthesis tyrosine autokinase [Anaerolineales bacterium]
PYGPNGLDSAPALSDDLRNYLALFWHWAWLLLSLTFVAAGLAFFLSIRQTPIYESSATMLIRESRAASESGNALTNERLAETYSKMMVQYPVLEGVIDELNLSLSSERIQKNLQVQVVPDTQLIVVSVQDTDPVRAAQIANTIGTVFARQNDALQASLYQETKQNLSNQIASTELQIEDTLAALEVLGLTDSSDLARNLLEIQLAAYYQVYEDLFQQVVWSEVGITPEGSTPANPATIRADLAEVDGLIQTTKEQLDVLGGNSETGVERDRLESNLALYRQTYANLVQSFEEVRLAEIENTSKVELVEPAQPAIEPILPNILQNTLLAAIVGLIGAGGLVFLMETLDDSVKSPEDVERHLGLPVLSIIAHFEMSEEIPITARHPRSPTAEAFRSLRTNIQFAGVDSPLRTLLVTSPAPEDGKSTISANLAVAIAQGQKKVILVDIDMRRPSLHKKFKTTNREGLSELFIKPATNLKDVMHATAVPGLTILNTGALPPNPSELINSHKMGEIIQSANQLADFVIYDTPPVMIVTDPSILAPQVDGVLLVLRVGATKLSAAKQSVDQLHRVGANLLGVVLNDIPPKRSRYYYYYNRYYNSVYYNNDVKVRS